MERQVTLKETISSAIKNRFVDLTDKQTFEKELSFAVQHIEKNPVLKKATIESNIAAVLNVAQTGLTLNPVQKLAYLVPRSRKVGNNWITETHLEPSYMGLCKAVIDSGSADQIYSHPVFEGDEFEVSLGMNMEVIHKPKYQTKTMTHVYMVAKLPEGRTHVEVMTKEDVDEIMRRSESYKAYEAKKIKSCVWVSDYTEMARKTVIRRGIKQLPKTERFNQVAEIVRLDETDYMASAGIIGRIENLLMTAAIEPEEQDSIYRELSTMSADRAREVVKMLEENQVDPIASGNNYSQADIQKKLNQ